MRTSMVVIGLVLVSVMGLLAASTASAADLTPVLISKEDVTPAPSDDVGSPFEYCYLRELVSCSACSYHTDCLLWYGWDNRYGEECIGRRVEYCDGHPTGIEYPVLELRCGC